MITCGAREPTIEFENFWIRNNFAAKLESRVNWVQGIRKSYGILWKWFAVFLATFISCVFWEKFCMSRVKLTHLYFQKVYSYRLTEIILMPSEVHKLHLNTAFADN